MQYEYGYDILDFDGYNLRCFSYYFYKGEGQANESFSQYAIGGSSFPMILIFFTQFATIMGAGNFIGHAGSGYEQGIGWLAFILGEQGSKIIFWPWFSPV